jgi:hypothetical protein
LSNSATGPADALGGSFDLSGIGPGDPFTLTGFGTFAGLEAGDSLSGLQISFASGVLGSFDNVVVVSLLSTNGSQADLALANVELRLQGTVVAVPEPGSYLLMAGGLLLLASVVRRRRRDDERRAA